MFLGKIRLPKQTTVIENCLIAFTGFIALSSFANVILDRMGFYLIEILFIPLLLFYYQRNKLHFAGMFKVKMYELVLLGLLIISVFIAIVNTGEIFAVVTCIRPFVYLLLVTKYIISNNLEFNINKLYILALGCVCGDLMYTQLFSALNAERGYQYINIIAIFMLTAIPFIKRKLLLSVISAIFAFAASLLSGYRINVLIFMVTMVSCILYLIITSKNSLKQFGYFLVLVGIVIALSWAVNNFDQVSFFLTDTFGLSEKTAERSLGRISDIINNDYTKGDQNRIEGFFAPIDEFGEFLVPRGPVGKLDLVQFGLYTDKPMFFFYDLFGSPLAWLIVIIYAVYFISVAIKMMAGKIKVCDYNSLFVILLPNMVFLLAINGTFLTFVHCSITFAIAVSGCAIRRKQV